MITPKNFVLICSDPYLYWDKRTKTMWEKYSHSITKSISLLSLLFRQPLCMCIHIFNVCLEQYPCPRINLKRKCFFLWSLFQLILATERSTLKWGLETVMASIQRIIKGMPLSNVIQACLFCIDQKTQRRCFSLLIPACHYVPTTKDKKKFVVLVK